MSRFGLGVLATGSVWCLLAWVGGFGSFSVWFLAASLPAVVCVMVASVWVGRARPHSRLDVALSAGVIGGLLGTIGYDVFRLPFLAFGLRLLAPIDSYGVLLLDADGSSPWTGLTGWAFHFSNGIGFGVAYALVALGRHWGWAVLWAMVLETATVVTPFATLYGLRGKPDLIAVAYAAHVAYGVPLGIVVQRAARRTTPVAPRAPVLLALCTALLLWHQPWSTSVAVRAGDAVAPGPSAVVRGGRLHPEWLRIPVGGCAVVRNDDDVTYHLTPMPRDDAALVPGRLVPVCYAKAGVLRVRTSSRAYSGGFVIVDAEARP